MTSPKAPPLPLHVALDWAASVGRPARLTDEEPVRLLLQVRSGPDFGDAVVSATSDVFIVQAFGVDELPDPPLQEVTLRWMADLNLRTNLARLGIIPATGEVRAEVGTLISAAGIEARQIAFMIADLEWVLDEWATAMDGLIERAREAAVASDGPPPG